MFEFPYVLRNRHLDKVQKLICRGEFFFVFFPQIFVKFKQPDCKYLSTSSDRTSRKAEIVGLNNRIPPLDRLNLLQRGGISNSAANPTH